MWVCQYHWTMLWWSSKSTRRVITKIMIIKWGYSFNKRGTAECRVQRVQCTVYNVQYAVCSMHCAAEIWYSMGRIIHKPNQRGCGLICNSWIAHIEINCMYMIQIQIFNNHYYNYHPFYFLIWICFNWCVCRILNQLFLINNL